jgi:hypothetical protein
MSKLLMLSVCFCLLGLPLWASRDPHPMRGLRKAVLAVLLFDLFYVFILRVVVPRLG